MREIGLGRARGTNAVTLANAREKAAELYRVVEAGLDPLAERVAKAEAERAEAAAASRRAITFREVAADYIAAHKAGRGNPKHKAQWGSTLEAYAYPHLGDVPIADVSTLHVLAVLEPTPPRRFKSGTRNRRSHKLAVWV
jgi:hypothetical protein